MTPIEMIAFYVPFLPELLVCLAIITVLLSVLEGILCRKNADRGLPLLFISLCAGGLAFLLTMRRGILWPGADWSNWINISAALIMLLIFAAPTMVFLLIYRAAKRKEMQEYQDS